MSATELLYLMISIKIIPKRKTSNVFVLEKQNKDSVGVLPYFSSVFQTPFCGLPPAPSHFYLIRFRYYKVEFVIFQRRFAHAQMRLRSSARGNHLCLRSSPLGSLFQPLS